MYKKNDFSNKSCRAISLHQDTNGEYGAIVYFGTNLERAALKKMHKVARAVSDLKLKRFPMIKNKESK